MAASVGLFGSTFLRPESGQTVRTAKPRSGNNKIFITITLFWRLIVSAREIAPFVPEIGGHRALFEWLRSP